MSQTPKFQKVAAALIPHGKVRLLESMINTGLNGNRTLRVRAEGNGLLIETRPNPNTDFEVSASVNAVGQMCGKDGTPTELSPTRMALLEGAVPLSAVAAVEGQDPRHPSKHLLYVVKTAESCLTDPEDLRRLGNIGVQKDNLLGNARLLKDLAQVVSLNFLVAKMNAFMPMNLKVTLEDGRRLEIHDLDGGIHAQMAAQPDDPRFVRPLAWGRSIVAEHAMNAAFRGGVAALDGVFDLVSRMSEHREKVRAETTQNLRAAQQQKAERIREQAAEVLERYTVKAGEMFTVKSPSLYGTSYQTVRALRDLTAEDFLEMARDGDLAHREGLVESVELKSFTLNTGTITRITHAQEVLAPDEDRPGL